MLKHQHTTTAFYQETFVDYKPTLTQYQLISKCGLLLQGIALLYTILAKDSSWYICCCASAIIVCRASCFNSNIVVCIAQDPRYPASNLMKSSGGSWLCLATDAKKTRAEISFRLSQSCILSHIDIGKSLSLLYLNFSKMLVFSVNKMKQSQ